MADAHGVDSVCISANDCGRPKDQEGCPTPPGWNRCVFPAQRPTSPTPTMRPPRGYSLNSLAIASACLGGPGLGAGSCSASSGVDIASLPTLEFTYEKMVKYVEKPRPYINGEKLPGRNDKCPCGSRRKFKKCCLNSRQNDQIHPRRA
jgi:hypothetical protein